MGTIDDNKITAKTSVTPAARILSERKDAIIVEWVYRVKSQVKSANALLNPVIVNTIPLFLEQLAESLSVESSQKLATESNDLAQEHGGERARVTQYGPEQIIHEYQILRDLVLEDLSDRTELRSRDLKVIQGSFDQALQDAMMAYFAVHSRLREQFIAVLTHDLRSPIAVMSMAADAIVESSEKPSESDLEDIRDMASRIKANAKRADRLIQNMLDVTLVQVGEAPGLHIQSGNLESVVEAAAFDRSRSELSRLEVNTESALGFWDIEALQRSIENLVSNAFKYGRPDTPVRVTAKPAFGRVMIMVHNEGNPIPAKDRENLFQAFKRSDSAVKSGKKGWGIGLSLVRSTCEALGGSLGVESSEEKGTTFTIDIPQDARPLVGAPITT